MHYRLGISEFRSRAIVHFCRRYKHDTCRILKSNKKEYKRKRFLALNCISLLFIPSRPNSYSRKNDHSYQLVVSEDLALSLLGALVFHFVAKSQNVKTKKTLTKNY